MTSTDKSPLDRAADRLAKELVDDLRTNKEGSPVGPVGGFHRTEFGAYIHSDAVIHPRARIGSGAIIWPGVEVGEEAVVGPYSVIGGCPEHRDFYHPKEPKKVHGVIIEAHARVFEFVTVHAGTLRPTVISSMAAVFNHAHIAHDAFIGHRAEIGGHASIAGHVHVMHHARISGRAVVHPKVVVGTCSIVALGAVVNSHVPMGVKWVGMPARFAGPNEIGMKRAGYLGVEELELSYGDVYRRRVEESGL